MRSVWASALIAALALTGCTWAAGSVKAQSIANQIAKVPGVAEADGTYTEFKGPSMSLSARLAPDGGGQTITEVQRIVEAARDTTSTWISLSIFQQLGGTLVSIVDMPPGHAKSEEYDEVLAIAEQASELGATQFFLSMGPDEAAGSFGCAVVFRTLTNALVDDSLELLGGETLCQSISVQSDFPTTPEDGASEVLTFDAGFAAAQADFVRQFRTILADSSITHRSVDFTQSDMTPFIYLSVDPKENYDDTWAMTKDELKALITLIHNSRIDLRMFYCGVEAIMDDGVLRIDEPIQDADVGQRPVMTQFAKDAVAELQR